MISMSCRIHGGDFDHGGQATRQLKEHLVRLGVSGAVMRRAMIASYEAEMNVVIHARTGTLWARVGDGTLDLEIADEGPGIPDVGLALREGWSTASARARELGYGAGLGLPNIRKNSDRFDLETRVGRGTRVRSTIFLEEGSAAKAPAAAASVAAEEGSPDTSQGPEERALAISPRRCTRCLRCIFSCPTGALRVHADGPILRASLCVGCTECASACARTAFGIREDLRLKRELPVTGQDAVLVVPRACLLSPFAGRSAAAVLNALGGLGFSEVRFTEEWEDAIRGEARLLASRPGAPVPLIPPLCPAVAALVESRFPSLIPNLAMMAFPLDAAGEEFPLRPVVLVAACAAQLASASSSSLTDRLTVTTPAGLCAALRAGAPRPQTPWSAAQAERAPEHPAAQAAAPAPALRAPRPPLAQEAHELRASGVRDVLRALSAAESGALGGITVLNLHLCAHGCSGSPFVTPDPFLSELAGPRLQPLLAGARETDACVLRRSAPYRQRTGMRLSADMASAIQALGRIDELLRTLPGRDCGACGAPTCALYAEDVVMGRAGSASCPHASLTPEVSP